MNTRTLVMKQKKSCTIHKRSEERRVGKGCKATRSKRDWSSDVCSSDLKEANSGDTARRIGNEFLFQEIAEKNIKEFTKNNVTKIVTIDPHAYNIFKNEYPDFGYEAEEVLHHTQ